MTARPLIDFPAPRLAPSEVLARLREVDARAELLFLGTVPDRPGHPGSGYARWLLGTVRPGDPAATRQGAVQIASARRWLTRSSLLKIRLGLALLQGFKPVEEYRVRGELDFARIVADFREREWRYQHRWEAEMEEAEERSDVEHDRAAAYRRAAETFRARAREAYRFAFRGARSVVNRGLPTSAPLPA